jgi:hypothetical protein
VRPIIDLEGTGEKRERDGEGMKIHPVDGVNDAIPTPHNFENTESDDSIRKVTHHITSKKVHRNHGQETKRITSNSTNRGSDW